MLTVLAATIGALLVMSTASASNTTTATNAETSVNANTSVVPDINQTMGMQQFGNFMMPGDQTSNGGPEGIGNMGQGQISMGQMSGMQGTQNLEISTAYNATVYSILNNDTNVQNLITQGYNVTSINPIVQNVIGGDGTITTQASTAIVTMQDGTSGYATVNVDITNAKVTQIVIITRTVIDESSS